MSIPRLIDQCERWAESGPLRFSLIITALYFALMLSVFRCGFQTNDDPAMMMIASGTGMCTAPDEHLIFTNVLIGLVLKGLYSCVNFIPWYGAYLVATQYLSHVAVLYSVLTWRYTRRYAELFYLFLLTIGIYYLTNLQFTITACYAVEAGIILGLTALFKRAENPKIPIRRMLIAAGGLILLGSMIRIDSLIATAVVTAPVALCLLWPQRRNSSVVRPAAGWIAITLTLIVGTQGFHSQYFRRDPAWCKFFEYNALRLKFNDHQWTHYDQETKAIFDQVHWSENDHAMVFNWYYEDDELFSAEKLRTILNARAWQPPTSASQRVGDFCVSLARDHSTWSLLLLLPLFVWCGLSRRMTLKFAMLGLLMAMGLLLYISLTVKPPPARVYYPLLANQLVFCLLLGRLGPNLAPHATGQWLLLHLGVIRSNAAHQRELVLTLAISNALAPTLLLVIATVGAIMTDYREYRHGRTLAKNAHLMRRALAEIKPRDDELYVNWGGAMPIESISPFEVPRTFSHFHMLMLGWPQRTPFHEAMKQRFHIQDLAKDLVNRSDLFLMSVDYQNVYFDTFAKEHQQTELEWKSCYSNQRFAIWKPYRAPPTQYDAYFEPKPDQELTSGAHFRRFQ